MKSFVKIGAAFLAVILVSIVLIFWLTAGEDHELQVLYTTLLSDARRYNADAVTSVVANTYNHNGYNYASLVRLIKTHVSAEQYEGIEERSVKYSVQGKQLAFVDAELDVIRSEMGRRFRIPIKIRLRFERSQADWEITAIDYEQTGR